MVRIIMGAVAIVTAFIGSSFMCAFAVIQLVFPSDLYAQFMIGIIESHLMILLTPIFAVFVALGITIGDILVHNDIKAKATWGLVLVVWLFSVLSVPIQRPGRTGKGA